MNELVDLINIHTHDIWRANPDVLAHFAEKGWMLRDEYERAQRDQKQDPDAQASPKTEPSVEEPPATGKKG